MVNYTIEIATADFATTSAAVEGGADRVELCAALTEGGTTPTYGMIKKCRQAFSISLFPMIRPRSGDFLYNGEEFEIMKTDIQVCKNLGCEGIVVGLLKKDGRIDIKRTAHLIDAAYPMEVTFHRAFDRCKDPFNAMESLIQIGCSRILTSGQQVTAPIGVKLIAELVKIADNRIVIMPGSGIRKDNIEDLANNTGAVEFHSSLRSKVKSNMEFIHPSFAYSEESYTNPGIDAAEIRALRKALPTAEKIEKQAKSG